jgi:hypothetical protein
MAQLRRLFVGGHACSKMNGGRDLLPTVSVDVNADAD